MGAVHEALLLAEYLMAHPNGDDSRRRPEGRTGEFGVRLLFAGLRWDYKNPARGDSFEYTNFWDTLRQMPGVEAELFPFDEVEARLGRQEMNRMLLSRVEESRPDLVFFLFFTDEFDPEVVKKISRRTSTLNWFADDHWRFRSYSRHWAPYLTWVATTYREAARGYRRLGFRNVILTQWACNHYLYRPRDVPRDLDITFVGQSHGTRRRIIEELHSRGIDVQAWGYGWPAGRLTQDAMIQVLCRSKINLNLSNPSREVALRPFLRLFLERRGGSIAPRTWAETKRNLQEWRGKRIDQIKARNFEIPGCRTLLLTNEVKGLGDYYEPGKEIVMFSEIDDLVRKIRHYLDAEEEREAIAEAGYERTLREHTYEIRFREMFERMGLA